MEKHGQIEMSEKQRLETILRVHDKLWYKIRLILDEHDPQKLTGSKRIDARAALNAIIFRLCKKTIDGAGQKIDCFFCLAT